MRKIFILLCAITFLAACEEEDDQVPAPAATNNQGNTNPADTNSFNNNYMFSDDNVKCEPLFGVPTIGANGILSLISRPCSNSGSKFDGYFNGRPTPGTYTVVGSVNTIPTAMNLSSSQVAFVFYGHGQSTLFSTAGTVEITKNASDTSKIDMNWSNVDMTFEHDNSVIQFSGNLKGM